MKLTRKEFIEHLSCAYDYLLAADFGAINEFEHKSLEELRRNIGKLIDETATPVFTAEELL